VAKKTDHLNQIGKLAREAQDLPGLKRHNAAAIIGLALDLIYPGAKVADTGPRKLGAPPEAQIRAGRKGKGAGA
jgi:hypothetical protein